MKIIKEGETSHTAYIVKEGDCMLVSSKRPATTNLGQEPNSVGIISFKKEPEISESQMRKGYMSRTTN